MKTKAEQQWTKPYFGVSHLGELCDRFRLTVCDYGTFCLLHKWYPGCGFSPIEEEFDTVAQAKGAGMWWLSNKGE